MKHYPHACSFIHTSLHLEVLISLSGQKKATKGDWVINKLEKAHWCPCTRCCRHYSYNKWNFKQEKGVERTEAVKVCLFSPQVEGMGQVCFAFSVMYCTFIHHKLLFNHWTCCTLKATLYCWTKLLYFFTSFFKMHSPNSDQFVFMTCSVNFTQWTCL